MTILSTGTCKKFVDEHVLGDSLTHPTHIQAESDLPLPFALRSGFVPSCCPYLINDNTLEGILHRLLPLSIILINK